MKAGPERDATRIANGFHPFGLRLRDERGETCGTCAHAHRTVSAGRKGFWKCALVKRTHGPGTDLRLKWPACWSWKAKP